MPPKQANKISGLTLMALARVSDQVPWNKATRNSHTIRKGIMDYVGEVLGNRPQWKSKYGERRGNQSICDAIGGVARLANR